jgi:hypothetical protein
MHPEKTKIAGETKNSIPWTSFEKQFLTQLLLHECQSLARGCARGAGFHYCDLSGG